MLSQDDFDLDITLPTIEKPTEGDLVPAVADETDDAMKSKDVLPEKITESQESATTNSDDVAITTLEVTAATPSKDDAVTTTPKDDTTKTKPVKLDDGTETEDNAATSDDLGKAQDEAVETAKEATTSTGNDATKSDNTSATESALVATEGNSNGGDALVEDNKTV